MAVMEKRSHFAEEVPAEHRSQQHPPSTSYPLQYSPFASQEDYDLAVLGKGYSPTAPLAVPQQGLQTEITIEEPFWDANTSICYLCADLRKPQGDQLSIIAPAAVEYTIILSADMCCRTQLPFLVNGRYQVDWPTNHSLSAVTNKQELEQVCEQCQVQTADQFHRVISN